MDSAPLPGLFAATTLPLGQVTEAVAHAAANAGPFRRTVLLPRA